MPNRIREIRKAQGLTQEELGERLNMDKWDVSRLERGKTQLKMETATQVAQALGVSLTEIMGVAVAGVVAVQPPGLSDELVVYVGGPGDPFMRLADEHTYPLRVETDALDKIGIQRGDVVIVDGSAKAVEAVRPLEAVRVQFDPDPDDPAFAVSLLRQFVPPSLVITNSSVRNERSIDLAHEDAQILGVVRSTHRALSIAGVETDIRGVRTQGRLIGTIKVNGRDVGEMLIAEGLARKPSARTLERRAAAGPQRCPEWRRTGARRYRLQRSRLDAVPTFPPAGSASWV